MVVITFLSARYFFMLYCGSIFVFSSSIGVSFIQFSVWLDIRLHCCYTVNIIILFYFNLMMFHISCKLLHVWRLILHFVNKLILLYYFCTVAIIIPIA